IERRPGLVDADAPADELHVLPDRAAEHAQHVRAGGGPIARSELLRVAGAAQDVPPLEDQRLDAGACQVEARDQAVVTASDDDGVVAPPASLRHPDRGRSPAEPGAGSAASPSTG